MKKELTFGKMGILLLFIFASGMLFSGCRKDKHNPMQFTINAYMPHTNAPVSGIKWKVIEKKSSGALSNNPHKVTDFELEGETDLNGQVNIEFIPFKNNDYYYELHFDYSEMDVPLGEYSITKGPTTYALLNRPISGVANDFEIRILPKMTMTIHFKNINCFDVNDTFKYKSYNSDELQYFTQAQVQSMPWTESPLFNECADFSGNADKLAGHYIYIWEAVRNGITETGTDTFFVAPGINSVINMHW